MAEAKAELNWRTVSESYVESNGCVNAKFMVVWRAWRSGSSVFMSSKHITFSYSRKVEPAVKSLNDVARATLL